MKTMKKLMTLVLSIAMVLAMSVTAMAATVTIPGDLDGHTFKAYQIFTGTQDENGKLGVTGWGDGINENTFVEALKADTKIGAAFANCSANNPAEVAAVIGKYNDKSDEAKEVAKIAYANLTQRATSLAEKTNDLPTGYYLFVDTTNVAGKEDMAANATLLQVVGTININVKTDKPSVEKKVQENTKYNTNEGYGQGYNDVADYNIGDTVPFKLIGTVPDMSEYTFYTYIFHDTMSKGLTLDADSIRVYVANDKEGTGKQDITASFAKPSKPTKNEAGETIITVSTDNLKDISGVAKGKFIIVEYNATLNENAEIGLPGNPNKVSLEYSNRPNQNGEGNSTGKTPEDHVIVFTYKLDTTKVDGNNNEIKLKDAEFKLKNAAGKWAVLVDGKVSSWVDEEAKATVLTSDENGFFAVTGLDEGTYYLKETKAPAGYNLPTSEFKIVITATTNNGQNWTNNTPSDALTKIEVTAGGAAGTGDVTTGVAAIKVVNNQGSTLPSTGGMGTTIFYVVGTILVLAAAVLLITKKRMHADK